MKQRLLSAAIGLVVLAIVLAFYSTFIFNIVVSVLALICIYEVIHATKCANNAAISMICFVYATLIPFIKFLLAYNLLPVISYILFISLFIAAIFNYNKIRIEQIGFCFFVTLGISLSFTIGIFIRDEFGMAVGLFYTLLALGSAWLSDTGAYFVGRTFGKHQLAPIISPKKTVEGAIGGVVFSEIAMVLVAFIYSQITPVFGVTVQVNYIALLLLVPICSMVSIAGDLSASIIKRQFAVKDFGNIMPGHGGVLDRFDSVLFVLPLIFIVVHVIDVIKIV